MLALTLRWDCWVCFGCWAVNPEWTSPPSWCSWLGGCDVEGVGCTSVWRPEGLLTCDAFLDDESRSVGPTSSWWIWSMTGKSRFRCFDVFMTLLSFTYFLSRPWKLKSDVMRCVCSYEAPSSCSSRSLPHNVVGHTWLLLWWWRHSFERQRAIGYKYKWYWRCTFYCWWL